jgi:hypothetical protein
MNIQTRNTEIDSRDFRKGIMAVEEKIKSLPEALGEDPFPLIHSFAQGLYIREIHVPSNVWTVTKIHKNSHVAFLLKGTLYIREEWGDKKITAPCYFITKAGTKRLIYHEGDVVLVTVHATEETDIEKIEEEIIAKSFDEMDNVIEIKEVVSCLG